MFFGHVSDRFQIFRVFQTIFRIDLHIFGGSLKFVCSAGVPP